MTKPTILTSKNGTCPLCGEETDNLAANPGKWPVEFECGGGDGGKEIYHRECVIGLITKEQKRLDRAAKKAAQPPKPKWTFIYEFNTWDEIRPDVIEAFTEHGILDNMEQACKELLDERDIDSLSDWMYNGEEEEEWDYDYLYTHYTYDLTPTIRLQRSESQYRKDQSLCDGDWGAYRVYHKMVQRVMNDSEKSTVTRLLADNKNRDLPKMKEIVYAITTLIEPRSQIVLEDLIITITSTNQIQFELT